MSEGAEQAMSAYASARAGPQANGKKRRSDSAGNKTFHNKKKANDTEQSIFLNVKGPDFFSADKIHNWLNVVKPVKQTCCSNSVNGRCCILNHFTNSSVTGLVR